MQTKDIENKISKAQLIKLIEKKIAAVEIERVKEDVLPFINEPGELAIWSRNYFKDLLKKLLVE